MEDVGPVAALSLAIFPAPHERANRHDAESLRDELERDIARLFVLEVQEAIAGYFVGWLVAGELQVHSIGVALSHRGKGLGNALLSSVLEEVARERATMATLELREDNVAARALYTRLGFREVGRRAHYYADGAAALLMQYDAP